MEDKFRKQFPSRKLLDIVSSTRIWKIQHNAAIIIQRAWRAYRARKHALTDRVKSTQTLKSSTTIHHSFGQKLGHFFHVGGDRRRRSSLRDGAPLTLRPGGAGVSMNGNSTSKSFHFPLLRLLLHLLGISFDHHVKYTFLFLQI